MAKINPIETLGLGRAIKPKLDALELRVLGRYLYGNGWQAHLSFILGVHKNTVYGWANAKHPIPPPAAVAVRLMVHLKWLYTQIPPPYAKARRQPDGEAT